MDILDFLGFRSLVKATCLPSAVLLNVSLFAQGF
ncbi:hypothetical protein AND_000105 [Anopheles darlingi]|uniref:Uncharacterized protein n=1 Tax=Anopheles darlingi TaxID=43151 RepID=W5JXB7_ANODA|nr:hypothetical protein AND_000105 [Anopheles darlingi]